jgi:uncharacterized protein (TIGR03382 family)
MLRIVLAGVAALAIATPASAGLLGSTVNVSTYFPDASTLFYDPGNAVVGASVEYPQGSYPPYNTSWEVDVSDNRITITDVLGTGLSFAPGSFNGFVLTVVSGPSIVSASVDAASTIVPVDVTVSGGRLFINFAGVSDQDFGSGIVTFVTGDVPVPAPAALALFGLGLVALGARRRPA